MSTFPDTLGRTLPTPNHAFYRLHVTDDHRAADQDVHDCVIMIATRLEQQVGQISSTIREALEDRIPELRGDARMVEMLSESVQANVATIFAALLHDTSVDRLAAPKAALDYARRVAQHDVPVNALVRAYRLGQRHMTELVFAELHALDLDPATRVAVIEVITTVVFEYVDIVSQRVVEEYEDERVRWLENQNSIRAMRVRDVLGDNGTGSDTDHVDAASAAIRYPLHWKHLALIVWHAGSDATGDELDRIQRFSRVLASAVGTSASPLFAAADRNSAWIWLPFRTAPGDVVAAIREYAQARPDSLNIAMGAPGSGIDGFRRSHRQAQRVRAAVLARGWEPPAIVAATDSGMMAAAILGTSIAEVRGWVADVLGSLASDTDDDAALRQTLLVFLRSGSNHETAARELDLTFKALRSRVERAVAQRGRSIDDRVDVELALFICDWYGTAVLTRS